MSVHPLRPSASASAQAATADASANCGTGFGAALAAALASQPRRISPKWLYDEAGSALFEAICELPEYYPTRTELGLLQAHASDIAALIGPAAEIVEFGAGASRKVRLLLDALVRPRRYVAIDISGEHLHNALEALREDYPGLEVSALAADFSRPMQLPAKATTARTRVGFFPGSSIGNFDPAEAETLLRRFAAMLRGGADAPVHGLLIGVDLVKPPALLHAAYNDAAGVTAAFNLNLLARANRELGTDFDLAAFDHYAFYQPASQRIEMHLLSRGEQRIHLAGKAYHFAEGESLRTECSYKYTLTQFQTLARRAGFRPRQLWCDPDKLFSLHWLELPATTEGNP